VAVAAAVAFGGFVWWQHEQAPVPDSDGGSISIKADNHVSQPSTAPVAVVASTPAMTPSPTPASVKMPSAGRATDTVTVPGPEGFGTYSQYASADSPMFVDLEVGSGAKAVSGSAVSVDYQGWLTNGQEFDESFARKQPFTFTLGSGQVIAGWDAGVAGMRVGGKRRLIIPAKFGYGAQAMPNIPANSLLVFDVWLRATK
jgi:hypothetical protein